MPTGTVIFWLERAPDKFGYGFIATDDAPDTWEANVWFSRRSLHYGTPRKGDRVEYTVMDQELKIGQSPTAAVVQLLMKDAT